MAQEYVSVKTASGAEYYVPKSVAESGTYAGEKIVSASGLYSTATGQTSTVPANIPVSSGGVSGGQGAAQALPPQPKQPITMSDLGLGMSLKNQITRNELAPIIKMQSASSLAIPLTGQDLQSALAVKQQLREQTGADIPVSVIRGDRAPKGYSTIATGQSSERTNEQLLTVRHGGDVVITYSENSATFQTLDKNGNIIDSKTEYAPQDQRFDLQAIKADAQAKGLQISESGGQLKIIIPITEKTSMNQPAGGKISYIAPTDQLQAAAMQREQSAVRERFVMANPLEQALIHLDTLTSPAGWEYIVANAGMYADSITGGGGMVGASARAAIATVTGQPVSTPINFLTGGKTPGQVIIERRATINLTPETTQWMGVSMPKQQAMFLERITNNPITDVALMYGVGNVLSKAVTGTYGATVAKIMAKPVVNVGLIGLGAVYGISQTNEAYGFYATGQPSKGTATILQTGAQIVASYMGAKAGAQAAIAKQGIQVQVSKTAEVAHDVQVSRRIGEFTSKTEIRQVTDSKGILKVATGKGKVIAEGSYTTQAIEHPVKIGGKEYPIGSIYAYEVMVTPKNNPSDVRIFKGLGKAGLEKEIAKGLIVNRQGTWYYKKGLVVSESGQIQTSRSPIHDIVNTATEKLIGRQVIRSPVTKTIGAYVQEMTILEPATSGRVSIKGVPNDVVSVYGGTRIGISRVGTDLTADINRFAGIKIEAPKSLGKFKFSSGRIGKGSSFIDDLTGGTTSKLADAPNIVADSIVKNVRIELAKPKVTRTIYGTSAQTRQESRTAARIGTIGYSASKMISTNRVIEQLLPQAQMRLRQQEIALITRTSLDQQLKQVEAQATQTMQKAMAQLDTAISSPSIPTTPKIKTPSAPFGFPVIPNIELGGAGSILKTATKVIKHNMMSIEKLLGIV